VLNGGGRDEEGGGASRTVMLYDQQSSVVALMASRPVEQLDGPAFREWVDSFFAELSELTDVLAEAAGEDAEAAAVPAGTDDEPWLKI
jgi:hypothetical protein